MMELIFLIFAVITTTYADYQPYIDGKYAYPKDDSLAVFPFDRSHVCKIRMASESGTYYASLENVYNIIDRTPLFGINTADGEENFLACFKYKQYSYVVYSNVNTSLTTIMRGHLSLTLRFPFKLDFLCYDQILSSLYAIAENQLFKVDLNALELLWTIQTIPSHQQLESLFTPTGIHWLINNDDDDDDGNVRNSAANHQPNTISDCIIANKTLFYYEQNRLYLYRTEIRLHPENNFFPTTIVPIKSHLPKISFLLFENPMLAVNYSTGSIGLEGESNGDNNSPLINIKIPLPSETLDSIIKPKNSSANDNEQNVQIEVIMWRTFLYCLDLIVILIILYFLRRQILRNKSQRKTSGDVELRNMMNRRSISSSYHSTTSGGNIQPLPIISQTVQKQPVSSSKSMKTVEGTC